MVRRKTGRSYGMNKQFGQIGTTYVAIHHNENKVYLCRDDEKSLDVQIWKRKEDVAHILAHTSLKEIDQDLFVSKFSACVAKLHSQTPYA
jgi:hypothetical protein